MNWKKIKTIFIITLLLTNLVLGAVLVYDRQGGSRDEVPLSDLLTLMRERQIDVKELSGNYPSEAHNLSVAYETYEMESIVDRFFNLSRFSESEKENQSNFEIKVVNEKVLLYSYKGHLVAKDSSTEEQARLVAENFITQLGFFTDDVRLESVKGVDFVTRLTYKEYYGDFFLEDAYMIVDVHDGRIVNFERMWLAVEGEGDEIALIDLRRALFRVMNKIDQARSSPSERREIVSVEVGYRLEGSSLIENIHSGEASPYYRMMTDDGKVYFIEATDL